jgi:hypothetical protein
MITQLKLWTGQHGRLMSALLLLAAAAFPIYILAYHWYYQPERIYSRSHAADGLTLVDKNYENNCQDGMKPCFIVWTYTYKAGNTQPQTATDRLNKILEAENFNRLDEGVSVSTEAKVTEKNQIQVVISQML